MVWACSEVDLSDGTGVFCVQPDCARLSKPRVETLHSILQHHFSGHNGILAPQETAVVAAVVSQRWTFF